MACCITGVSLMISLLTLSSCYYTTQGYYLLDYTLSAKNIHTLLQDTNTDTNTQQFLNKVLEIRQYAIDLGMSHSKNYTTYKNIDREYLVAVVHAAHELSVEPYKWKYPFLGRLPYRGYYNIEEAQAEAEKLQQQQHDVLVRRVAAFSTLGIFSDPIYSFMQQYSESRLIELILHEQMHATIWVKNQDAFNEQLATFIARQGMLAYIAQTYGAQSEQYTNIFIKEEDYKTYIDLLLDTKAQLEHLYNTPHISSEEKLIEKRTILTTQQEYLQANYHTLFKSDAYKDLDLTKYNNAFFSLISTYQPSTRQFQDAFERCNEDIGLFIRELTQLLQDKNNKENPYALLESIPRNL